MRPRPSPFPPYFSGVFQQFEESAAPQPTLLTVHLDNVTAYYQDNADLRAFARTQTDTITDPDPTNNNNNFFMLEVVGDITQINDDTAVRGLYLSKNVVTKSSPTAATGSGTMISDASITGFRHDIFKILYLDPTAPPMTPPTTMEIGSITAAGVSGKPIPPGGPTDIVGGDWAITGGTGAFWE